MESTQAYSQQSHWTQSQSLKPLSVQNFFNTIDLNVLSSMTFYANVNCAENKGSQWWASAVFELASEIPDSDFYFDFLGL